MVFELKKRGDASGVMDVIRNDLVTQILFVESDGLGPDRLTVLRHGSGNRRGIYTAAQEAP